MEFYVTAHYWRRQHAIRSHARVLTVSWLRGQSGLCAKDNSTHNDFVGDTLLTAHPARGGAATKQQRRRKAAQFRHQFHASCLNGLLGKPWVGCSQIRRLAAKSAMVVKHSARDASRALQGSAVAVMQPLSLSYVHAIRTLATLYASSHSGPAGPRVPMIVAAAL
mmetsp:Transcript_56344/g.111988  ORF Transcript_56344/g.111988 Transcript_56344/m.111988 type:complete len:165 (-) Transcript_56344:1016-1510(-)